MIYLIQHNGNALSIAIAITGMARIGTIFLPLYSALRFSSIYPDNMAK